MLKFYMLNEGVTNYIATKFILHLYYTYFIIAI